MTTPRHNIEKLFRNFFEVNSFLPHAHYLLAVSGGIDSVVLCELFRRAGMTFSIAHCNFQLRGQESKRDADFVRSLANKYGVKLYMENFDTGNYANVLKISIQEAARQLRYEYFDLLIKEKDPGYIVTAHHADDNVETLLMNFFRGTGLQGLTGMPAINKNILRPLLHCRRTGILDFANENGLAWVEDSSNDSLKYTRNYFRNELIPQLKNIYPAVDMNLLNNIERFKKINSFYQHSVEKIKNELVEKKGNAFMIPIRKLKKYDHMILVYEIIKEFGFGEKQVDEVIKLMDSTSGKFIANENFQVIRHGLWLVIAPCSFESETIAIDKGEEKVVFRQGTIFLKSVDREVFKMDRSQAVAQLDSSRIEFPLILRKWKQGDYFYPLGLSKKKKLARFFIDIKLPKNEKENTWVLESNKKIIWIIGHRIDHRFRITDSTRSILTITYQHQALGA